MSRVILTDKQHVAFAAFLADRASRYNYDRGPSVFTLELDFSQGLQVTVQTLDEATAHLNQASVSGTAGSNIPEETLAVRRSAMAFVIGLYQQVRHDIARRWHETTQGYQPKF